MACSTGDRPRRPAAPRRLSLAISTTRRQPSANGSASGCACPRESTPKRSTCGRHRRRAEVHRGDVVGAEPGDDGATWWEGEVRVGQPGDVVPVPRRDARWGPVGQRRRNVATRRRRSRRLRRLVVRCRHPTGSPMLCATRSFRTASPEASTSRTGSTPRGTGRSSATGTPRSPTTGSALSASCTGATSSVCANDSTTSRSSVSTCSTSLRCSRLGRVIATTLRRSRPSTQYSAATPPSRR